MNLTKIIVDPDFFGEAATGSLVFEFEQWPVRFIDPDNPLRDKWEMEKRREFFTNEEGQIVAAMPPTSALALSDGTHPTLKATLLSPKGDPIKEGINRGVPTMGAGVESITFSYFLGLPDPVPGQSVTIVANGGDAVGGSGSGAGGGAGTGGIDSLSITGNVTLTSTQTTLSELKIKGTLSAPATVTLFDVKCRIEIKNATNYRLTIAQTNRSKTFALLPNQSLVFKYNP